MIKVAKMHINTGLTSPLKKADNQSSMQFATSVITFSLENSMDFSIDYFSIESGP